MKFCLLVNSRKVLQTLLLERYPPCLWFVYFGYAPQHVSSNSLQFTSYTCLVGQYEANLAALLLLTKENFQQLFKTKIVTRCIRSKGVVKIWRFALAMLILSPTHP